MAKSSKFEWYMLPSVLVIGALVVLFVWSVAHGIRAGAEADQQPTCEYCGQ